MSGDTRSDSRSAEDDETLVAGVASGSTAALASLYDLYASRLLGAALRVLGDRRDAEDLLHDVFLEVWRTSSRYDPARASVYTWLHVKVRSRALDRLRALGVARRFGLGSNFEEQEAEDPEACIDLLRHVDRSRALEALAELPETQRDVVSMMYLEGRSCSEIASRCEMPIGTVKSRLARGLTLLRVRLDDVEEPG